MKEYFYEAKVRPKLNPDHDQTQIFTKPHFRRQQMYKGAMARKLNHHNFEE